MASKKRKRTKKEREAWNRFGDAGRSLLVSTATLLPHRAKGDRVSPGTALLAVKLITEGLKLAFPEERPNGQGRHSFPSEHAAQSTAAAIIIEHEYPGKVGAAAYALAATVALSRIEGKKHYPRDVLAGALIGCAAVWATTRFSAMMRDWESAPKSLAALSKL